MLFKVTLKAEGHKISLIKLLRYVSDLGLKEAKDFVENYLVYVGDSTVVRVANPARAFEALYAYDTSRIGAQDVVWSDLVKIEPLVTPVPTLTTKE